MNPTHRNNMPPINTALKKAVEKTLPKVDIIPATTKAGLAEASSKSAEVIATVPGFNTEVAELLDVSFDNADDDTYLYADALLGRIRDTRRGWGLVWDRIQAKTIQPIRAGLDNLYAMNREADKPLESMETRVKNWMRDYKLEEARRIREAAAAKEREVMQLQAEADKKAEQIETARTAQMREKLRIARENLESKAEELATEETPAPVQAAHSAPRTKRAWRLLDIKAFCRGVAEGSIDPGYVSLNVPAVNRLYRDNPAVVEAWPGVEGFDDIQIAGR